MGLEGRLPLGKNLSWKKLKEAILSQVSFLLLASFFNKGPGRHSLQPGFPQSMASRSPSLQALPSISLLSPDLELPPGLSCPSISLLLVLDQRPRSLGPASRTFSVLKRQREEIPRYRDR